MQDVQYLSQIYFVWCKVMGSRAEFVTFSGLIYDKIPLAKLTQSILSPRSKDGEPKEQNGESIVFGTVKYFRLVFIFEDLF